MARDFNLDVQALNTQVNAGTDKEIKHDKGNWLLNL